MGVVIDGLNGVDGLGDVGIDGGSGICGSTVAAAGEERDQQGGRGERNGGTQSAHGVPSFQFTTFC